MAGWSISRIIVAIIVLAGCLAILWVALGALGIAIPAFVVTCLWIVLIVAVCVIAVKIIASML